MKYLLDTNICIYFFKGQYDLAENINEIGVQNCGISEITLAELIYGAAKSQNVSKNMLVVNSFADKISIMPIIDGIEIYDREKARLKTKGTLISDLDLFL